MFSFFKRIRKDLLNTGKVSRYLAYAVGEIFRSVIRDIEEGGSNK